MKTPLIRSWYTYESKPAELSPGPSLTIPGKARTIQQLMQQIAQGMPVNENVHNQYFDDVDIEEIDKFFGPSLDLTDLDELRMRTDQLSAIVKAAEDKRAKEQAEKEMQALKEKQKREAFLQKQIEESEKKQPN